jgi:hypothetical protein
LEGREKCGEIYEGLHCRCHLCLLFLESRIALVSFAFGGMLLAVVVLLVIGKFSVEEEVRRLSEGGVVGRGQRAR